MRHLTAVSIALLATACARTPEPQANVPAPTKPAGPVSALVGLTANELISHFGQPRLQVKEGPGLKMQWTSATCVLDIYLYPEGGREKATHIDSRRPTGDSIDQRSCVATLTR